MKTAIVLGGTLPHVALVDKLKSRGYYVVLVDYLEDPPAKHNVNEHVRESTLDAEKVLQIAIEKQASLVISTCIDQANVTACYVAEKLGLPSPYSHETALLVTNKVLMKERLIGHGISTSRYVRVSCAKEAQCADLDYPLIVKPVDSNSSKGVRRVDDLIELERFLPEAMQFSRSGDAIVEEFISGVEIGIDCMVVDGRAHVVMTKERRKINLDYDSSQQIQGCFWPAGESEELSSKFRLIANQIAAAFELKTTPLMIQVLVRGDFVSVIEFGARIGGGESFRVIEKLTGFDFVDAAIRSFLGEPISVDTRQSQGFLADNFIYVKACTFGEVICPSHLIDTGVVEYMDQYKSRGVMVGSELSSNNRVGVFTVKSETKCDLIEKITKAVHQIDVLDFFGASVMRKDVYN